MTSITDPGNIPHLTSIFLPSGAVPIPIPPCHIVSILICWNIFFIVKCNDWVVKIKLWYMYSGWPYPSCWACEASCYVFQRLLRDPSLRSGWPYPSCWACEASCYVFQRPSRDPSLRSGWRLVFRMTVCVQCVRHAELAKHLAMIERSFTAFRDRKSVV